MKNIGSGYVCVMDSGIGGLTVLNTLRVQYPRVDFVYFADGAFCPYGTKRAKDIYERLCLLIRHFIENGAMAVVLACNTASIHADRLRGLFDLPIYDVIEPTCRVVAATTVTRRVAVLATDATVASGIYPAKLAVYGIHTEQFACSELVPFVERGELDRPACLDAVREALVGLAGADADTVVLGCTHFPLLQGAIEYYTGDAHIVQCVTAPLQSLCYGSGKTVYLTSGDVAAVNRAARCLGRVSFVHTDI